LKKKIAILGLGLIGGSIAKALKSTGENFYISAFDKHDVLDKAFEQQVVDEKLRNEKEAVNSDIIFLCLPSELSLKKLAKLSPLLNKNSIVTDVCGVKGIFYSKWKNIKSKGTYIGGHPMTGKEKSGFENSDPLLFENSVYILSNKPRTSKSTELIKLIELLGARVKFLDPYVHDKIIANVSHLPQLLAVALINSVSAQSSNPSYLDFAAGGFRDMTRIANNNFDIWKPVFQFNKDEISLALKNLESNLKSIQHILKTENYGKLKKLFNSASESRDQVPKNTKGFLKPLYDIFVFVKDEPGVLSKITTSLYNNSINIKDMELLKIREGTGGTFRLSFQSKDEVSKAVKVIQDIGFKVNF
jgi:prephenate dehydrogenase